MLINKTARDKDGNCYEMGSMILFCSLNYIMECLALIILSKKLKQK